MGRMKAEGLTDVGSTTRSTRRFNGKPEIKYNKPGPTRVNVELLMQHVGLSVRAAQTKWKLVSQLWHMAYLIPANPWPAFPWA